MLPLPVACITSIRFGLIILPMEKLDLCGLMLLFFMPAIFYHPRNVTGDASQLNAACKCALVDF